MPTPFLLAYQQHNYCPTACKISDRMTDPNARQVFYCDFRRFSAPDFAIHADTIILVDEFHELFFN